MYFNYNMYNELFKPTLIFLKSLKPILTSQIMVIKIFKGTCCRFLCNNKIKFRSEYISFEGHQYYLNDKGTAWYKRIETKNWLRYMIREHYTYKVFN